ncbi:MAG: CoA pyrophosphatase [Prolixibacteraceae bacterium]|nr:CoA pyrophosphatase [Prolixibacteraceae bacterium]
MLINNITIDEIKIAIKRYLPGNNAHLKMIPKDRNLIIPEKNTSGYIDSAVLIILFNIADNLNFCLIRRSHKLKYHPGQISFPGGKIEKGESDFSITALREANEEIGLDSNKIEIIGNISNVYIPVSNFMIYPVLAYSEDEPILKANESEVDEIIYIPVNEFFNPVNITEEIVKTGNSMIKTPCYKINGNIIWGATAMLINEFCEIIINHRTSI